MRPTTLAPCAAERVVTTACLAAAPTKLRLNARCYAPFERTLYRERCRVEHTVGHLKECRAIATRCDKLAVNNLSMVQVALLFSCLRRLHPSDSA